MAADTQSKHASSVRPSIIPVGIVFFVTLAALTLGWVVKMVAESQTRNVERAGITASVPAGWTVRFGVAQEETIFSASDPFNPKVSFSLSLFPGVPGGRLTDSVASRNLTMAKTLSTFKVMDQGPIKERNREGYQVVFVYVQPHGPDILPEVVKGVDHYFAEGDQVLVFTMTAPVSRYEESLSKFNRFVRSGRVAAGGIR